MAGTLSPMLIVRGSRLPVIQSTWSSRATHWNRQPLTAGAVRTDSLAGTAAWPCTGSGSAVTTLARPIVMPVASSMPALMAPVTGTSTTIATPRGPDGNTTARTNTPASGAAAAPPEAAAWTPYARMPSKPSHRIHAGRNTGARSWSHAPAVTGAAAVPAAVAGALPPQRPGSTGTAASESPGYALPASAARRRRTLRIAAPPSRDSRSAAASRATVVAWSARSVSALRMRNELRLANSRSPDRKKNVTIRIAGTTPMKR